MRYFNTGYYRDFMLAGDERRVHYELLIAAPTKKAAMEATRMNTSYWRNYVRETSNTRDIAELDTFPPCTPLVRRMAMSGPVRGGNLLRPLEDAWAETQARLDAERIEREAHV